LAYATRRVDSIEAARVILLDALAKHPEAAIIHYNLACYDCQLGHLDSAKQFLARAVELSPGYKRIALEDDDLKPLRTFGGGG
jgi:Tfp pilus assembly protein PilF